MARFQKTQRQISSLRNRADMYEKNIMKDRFKVKNTDLATPEDTTFARRFSNNANKDLALRKQYKKRFDSFGISSPKGIATRYSIDMATTQQPWWMKPGGKK